MIYDIHTSVAICKGCNAFLLPYYTQNPILFTICYKHNLFLSQNVIFSSNILSNRNKFIHLHRKSKHHLCQKAEKSFNIN